MSIKFKILDCTLRDGGYYTNWDFKVDFVDNYLKQIDQLPVDYIELGYVNEEQGGYYGQYYYLDKDILKTSKEALKSTKIAIMIDAKNIASEMIAEKFTSLLSYVDLIRIAVDPTKLDSVCNIVNQLNSIGFEVAINLMYLSKLKISVDFIDSLKKIEPNLKYLYLVDSYGSCEPLEVEGKITSIKKQTELEIGFHGHNNIELAFANTLGAIKAGATIVDSTIMGMGRGAGNLKTELLLAHAHAKGEKTSNLNKLNVLVSNMTALHNQHKWGTNFPYMLSGTFALPQKNVMEWITTNRFSINTIVNAIIHSQEKETFTIQEYKPETSYANAVIVGGGNSVKEHCEKIKQFLHANPSSLIIHSSIKYLMLFSEFANRSLLCLSGSEPEKLHEYHDENIFRNIKAFVLPPSPRKMVIAIPNAILNKLTELGTTSNYGDLIDSPLAIAMEITIQNKCNKVQLLGFDGYTQPNYGEHLLNMENQKIIDMTVSNNSQIEIIALTKTIYKNLKQESVYAK